MLKASRRHDDISTSAANGNLAQLMARIQTGDQTALASLYDATVGQVYARSLRLTGNVADAEDVTLDVYQQLWLNSRQFNPQRGSPLQWLMVIARSRALDCCRKRLAQRQAWRGAVSLDDCDSGALVEDMHHQYEAARILSVPLSQLNPVQLRMIGMAFFDGLTHREIAECTRLPLGTVKSHLCRALQAMRLALIGHGTNPEAGDNVHMPPARTASGIEDPMFEGVLSS